MKEKTLVVSIVICLIALLWIAVYFWLKSVGELIKVVDENGGVKTVVERIYYGKETKK